jgi:15-cis-phytoene synthase/lycopene beta-cyclase
MVDDPTSSAKGHEKKIEYLAAIKGHLIKSYEPNVSPAALDAILDLLDLEESDRAVFHAFSHLIPRLVPIHPFLELCHGYETDLHFSNQLAGKGALSTGELWKCLPIITNADLLAYADDVAGSVASACCYLAWSILSPSQNQPTRPVLEYTWVNNEETGQDDHRIQILKNAREMGWALQLVNIARDMKKDALNSRVYIPLSSFPSSDLVLAFLQPKSGKPLPSCQPQVLGLVDIAYSLRDKTAPYMELLPREARGGLRAMVASYFEIAEEIVRRQGEVEDAGVKVSSWRRARAASAAFWGLA